VAFFKRRKKNINLWMDWGTLSSDKPMQGLQDRNHVYCLVDLRPIVDAILVYESSCNCGGHSLGDPFMEE
jgi:hypothetical protein